MRRGRHPRGIETFTRTREMTSSCTPQVSNPREPHAGNNCILPSLHKLQGYSPPVTRMHKGKTPLIKGDLLDDGEGCGQTLGKLCPWATKPGNWQTAVHQNLFLSLKAPTVDVWGQNNRAGE